MDTLIKQRENVQTHEQVTGTQGARSSKQNPVQGADNQTQNSISEQAKAMVKFSTPLSMIEFEPESQFKKYETFYISSSNVALLLNHYLPGTLVEPEVINVTENDVVHVKVTLTVMNSDGSIANRVSGISGQRTMNQKGIDPFAVAKAQSYAFKKTAKLLGIGADLDILLSDKEVKNNVRKGYYKKGAQPQNKRTPPNNHPAPSSARNNQVAAAAQARSAPKRNTSAARPPTNGQISRNQNGHKQTGSTVHPAGQKILEQKRNHFRKLSQKMGLSEEDMQKRLMNSHGKYLEEFAESDLESMINVSLDYLSRKKD